MIDHQSVHQYKNQEIGRSLSPRPQQLEKKSKKITKDISIEVDKSQISLIENIEIEDKMRFSNAIINGEEILVVSERGLQTRGVFGWEAVINKAIIVTCYGKVRGRVEMMYSFRTEATGMLAFLFLTRRTLKLIPKLEYGPTT